MAAHHHEKLQLHESWPRRTSFLIDDILFRPPQPVAMALTWLIEEEFKFIGLVQANPILWDVACTQYRRTDYKEMIWEQVVQDMGKPGLTVELAKKKWTLLRDSYRRNCRKVTSTTRTGAGTSDIFTPRWKYYESMAFLRSCPNSASVLSSMDGPSHHQSTETTGAEESSCDLSYGCSLPIVESPVPGPSCPASPPAPRRPASPPAPSRPASPPAPSHPAELAAPRHTDGLSPQPGSDFAPSPPSPPIEVRRPLYQKKGAKRKTEDAELKALLAIAQDTAIACRPKPQPPPSPAPDEPRCVGLLVEAKLRTQVRTR
ncbi:MADF [Nesidiocoris tenuis]|uniref:MADF n=1 Tax=Nesidiocoris tenuis TaxID=355587 RepID=A0ABN7AGS4_9HEMI|nr:MADF [Nesidiocoris tenuis]